MQQFLLNTAITATGATGYIYPNEFELHWGLLVVIYPYLTGLVAGAFILQLMNKSRARETSTSFFI